MLRLVERAPEQAGLILPGEACDIARRVRDGDPLVGWRGDPSMDCYVARDRGIAQVWAFDGHGERYCAVEVRLAPGWQHALLAKLRDGDWRRGQAVYHEFLDRRERMEAAKEAERSDLRLATADKLAWALRRDVGHLMGGTRVTHGLYGRR